MNKNQQNIDPTTWEKVIRIAIAVLSALLGFFGGDAARAAVSTML